MQYRIAYEHCLQDAPDDFVVRVPSQLVDDIPANIAHALLPEYIADLLQRRPLVDRICAIHPRLFNGFSKLWQSGL
jgi:hypothetical protein